MLTRSPWIAFVAFVLGTAPLLASTSGKSHLSTDRSPLRLTLAVLGQKYCAAYEDMDMLHAEVLLTFTNISNHPLILYRGSNLVVRTLVSKSVEEAAAGKHELDAVPTWITSGPSKPREYGKTPDNDFTILPPGGTFETNTVVGFAVSRSDEAPSHMIRSGMHVLEVVVSTWPESAARAKELAARWANSGSLWYTSIRSEPVVVRVDSSRSVEDCSKYAALLEAAKQDPNAVEKETGITALMAAIELNDTDLFSSLIERGARVDAQAPGGMTALILASGSESAYVTQLLKLGANVNARSISGQTPLAVAVRAGKTQNVKLLLAAGAYVNAPGPDGKTPLKLGTDLSRTLYNKNVSEEIIGLLKRAGAKE